jgi:hypothetical protein
MTFILKTDAAGNSETLVIAYLPTRFIVQTIKLTLWLNRAF